MTRLLKSLACLCLIDSLLYAVLAATLQRLPPQEVVCQKMTTYSDICPKMMVDNFLAGLNSIAMGTVGMAAAAAAVWIIVAYAFGDTGTPAGLRKKHPLWWVMGATGCISAALSSHSQGGTIAYVQQSVVPTISSLAALAALLVFFVSTLVSSPWVIRDQVPFGRRLSLVQFP